MHNCAGEGRPGLGRTACNEHDIQRISLFGSQNYNDDLLAGLETISLGLLCNNNNNGHSGENMGLDNPNGAFAFDGDDIANDDELHI